MSISTYRNLKRNLDIMLREQKYYHKVAVEFLPTKEGEPSQIVYWTEAQIRALQVYVARMVKMSNWETTQKWLSTFIVYNGPTKRGSKPMHFQSNGKFVEDFKPGFMDICDNLAIQLFELDEEPSVNYSSPEEELEALAKLKSSLSPHN